MKHKKRGPTILVKVLAVALAVIAMWASAAAAGHIVERRYWNSSSNPLQVTGYGSTGKGYGSWGIANYSSGTRYRTAAKLWLNNADNHRVYARTNNMGNSGICLAPQYTSCTQSFYSYNWGNTSSHASNTWTWKYGTDPIDAYSNAHRGRIWVKLDVPWRTDPSAGPAVTTGINY